MNCLLSFHGGKLKKPKRIYFNWHKGKKLPPGAKLVTRPSRWGNPFRVGDPGVPDRATAVQLFEPWLLTSEDPKAQRMRAEAHLLGGHDIACSCPPGSPCHGDVLLRLSNVQPLA